MTSNSLSEFVARVVRNKRITFGDVKRLQRDILPHGIGSREDAEILIALDQAVAKTDQAWTGYLVSAVVDFVVWGTRPTGYIDTETARWLAAWLATEKPSKAAIRIAQEAISEAQDVDETLLAVVADAPRRGYVHGPAIASEINAGS